MSLLIFPKTINTLSALEIDVDKDWQGFGITNLKGLAGGMQKGDVLIHNGNKIVKLSPQYIGDELNSGGTGQMAAWQAPPAP